MCQIKTVGLKSSCEEQFEWLKKYDAAIHTPPLLKNAAQRVCFLGDGAETKHLSHAHFTCSNRIGWIRFSCRQVPFIGCSHLMNERTAFAGAPTSLCSPLCSPKSCPPKALFRVGILWDCGGREDCSNCEECVKALLLLSVRMPSGEVSIGSSSTFFKWEGIPTCSVQLCNYFLMLPPHTTTMCL